MTYRLKAAAARGSRRVYADNWTAAGRTMKGVNFHQEMEELDDRLGTFFCAVCDGVGEYDGQRASQAVVAAMNTWWDSLSIDEREGKSLEPLAYGLTEAGAASLDGHSIYTTLSLTLVRGLEVFALNLGDSPIFLGRDELSERHNNYYMNSSKNEDHKRELVYSVRDGVNFAHTEWAKLAPGTPLLLCSDGIEPEAILCSEFFGAVRNAANQPGADNVTAIMVELV